MRWTRAVAKPQFKDAQGLVTGVLANDTHVDELTMYDVTFEFGSFTLYGTQLESATINHAGGRRGDLIAESLGLFAPKHAYCRLQCQGTHKT